MRNDSNKYKKFVGNRAEGQGFAEKRKKKIQYEYMKMLRKEKRRGEGTTSNPVNSLRRDEDEFDDQESPARNTYTQHSNRHSKIIEGDGEETPPEGDTRLGGEASIQSTSTSQHSNLLNRQQDHREFKREGRNAFSKAQFEAKKNKQEADRRREQIQKQKQEKEAALQKYKSKKRDNYFKFHCKRTRKGQPVMKYQMEFLLQKIEKQRDLDKNK